MYQLILVISTCWENQGQWLGGLTSQMLTGDDVETLKEKGEQIAAQFRSQGITVAWTVA